MNSLPTVGWSEEKIGSWIGNMGKRTGGNAGKWAGPLDAFSPSLSFFYLVYSRVQVTVKLEEKMGSHARRAVFARGKRRGKRPEGR